MSTSRIGLGRQRGAVNYMTRMIDRELQTIPGEDLGARLMQIVENPAVQISVRLEALRRMGALFAGRIAYHSPRTSP